MKRPILFGVLAMMAMVIVWGCSSDDDEVVTPPMGEDKSCLGCHSSEDMLKDSLAKTSGSKVPVKDKGDG